MQRYINIDYFQKLIDLNISCIPVTAKKKNPIVKGWKQYQQTKPNPEEIAQFVAKQPEAIAAICGAVSGNLEVIDFDCKYDTTNTLFDEYCAAVEDIAPGLTDKVLIQATQNKGYHFIYRCSEIEGNKPDLAQRPATPEEIEAELKEIEAEAQKNPGKKQRPPTPYKTLIETRGEGGYFLIAPSPGYNFSNNQSLSDIKEITPAERKILFDVARGFNQYVNNTNEVNPRPAPKRNFDGLRPGDDFNQRGDIIHLLQNHGWEIVSKHGDILRFKRPGKDGRGWSATWNHIPDRFFVFTSNGAPFQPLKSYTKFSVYAHLEHNGDFNAAARELSYNNYGDKPTDKRRGDSDGNSKKSSDIDSVEQFIKENFIIKYNEIKNKYLFEDISGEIDQKNINESTVYNSLKRNGFKYSKTDLEALFNDRTIIPAFNPIKDYFNHGLIKWDGKKRIDELCDHFRLKNENDKEFFTLMFKKHLVRSVNCVMSKHFSAFNKQMLVFVSPAQNIGKSSFLRWLVPNELKDYYYENSMIPTDKDGQMTLYQNFIVNMDELGNSKKVELNKLKSILSTDSINVRLPYDKNFTQAKRISSFFGSTNDFDFLMDGENVRWVCFEVKSIDFNYSKKFDVNQIWAEALNLYRENPDWGTLTKEEISRNEERNESFRMVSTERDVITEFFEPATDQENHLSKHMSSTEILIYLNERLESNVKLNPIFLGKELQRLGFEKCKTRENGRQKHGYWVKELSEPSNLDLKYRRLVNNYKSEEKEKAPF